MRAHTADDLPGRCKQCWLKEAFCLCGRMPTLEPAVPLVLIRHRLEARKSTNTARIAALVLRNATLCEFGDDVEQVNTALPDLTGAWLVFPGEEEKSVTPSTPLPTTLVMVDGTWRQTRKMVKKLSRLAALPRLSLKAPGDRVLRLRESHLEEGRSTLEAIADAYGHVGEGEVADQLHALYRLFVEHVFRARGVWETKRRAFVQG